MVEIIEKGEYAGPLDLDALCLAIEREPGMKILDYLTIDELGMSYEDAIRSFLKRKLNLS